MASKETTTRLLPFATGTGSANAGAPIYVGDLDPATLVLSLGGTFNATVQFETSIDGLNWFAVGSTFASASGQINVATTGTAPRSCALWARVSCTAFTSDTSALATVAGMPISL